MIEYPAQITYSDSDNCYLVDFPDLPGCHTFGADLEEALDNAREALSGYLESIDQRRICIPRPLSLKGKNIHMIYPERAVAFAVWLKLKRAEKGLTQKKAAQLMGINFQSYQKYENPKTANPTLKTIEKIEKSMGEKILQI
jgi:antitoxin HicB